MFTRNAYPCLALRSSNEATELILKVPLEYYIDSSEFFMSFLEVPHNSFDVTYALLKHQTIILRHFRSSDIPHSRKAFHSLERPCEIFDHERMLKDFWWISLENKRIFAKKRTRPLGTDVPSTYYFI